MHYDEIFHYLGRYNRYLWSSYLLISLALMSEALHVMINLFILAETDHWCSLPDWQDVCDVEGLNATECRILLAASRPPDDPRTLLLDENKCSQYDYSNFTLRTSNSSQVDGTEHRCENGWTFDKSQYKTTATQEFELVCSSAQLVSVAWSSTFIGFMLSTSILGILSDRYGRKRLIVVCLACLLLSDFAAAFSPSYWLFVTLRFMSSVFSAGVAIPAIIYAAEVVGTTERTLSTTIATSFWSIGYAISALYAYFIRYWRTLLMVICAADVIIAVVIVFLVPESPRWLHSVDRFDEAETIIRKAAKYGNEEIPDGVYKDIREREATDGNTNKKGSFIDLFRNKIILFRVVVNMILQFVICIVFFGVSLGALDFSSNGYLSVALSGVIEIPAVFVSRYAMDRWGRRPVFGTVLALSGASCIGIAFTNGWLTFVLGLIGKFSATSCYNVQFMFVEEMLPTPIRNIGIGMVTTMGQLGSVLAPQVMYIGAVWKQLPYLVFGALSGISLFLIMCLPETNGIDLPQTIQEGVTLGVKIKSSPMKKIHSNSECYGAPPDVLEMTLEQTDV